MKKGRKKEDALAEEEKNHYKTILIHINAY
jgi:hypothetical protein